MTRVLKILDALCSFGAAIAALACAAMAAMLVIEVITTSFLSYSQPWAVEYSGYLLAATLFAGSGWTLSHGGHIRVALLLQMLSSKAFRIADLAINLFAFGIAIYVSWAVVENAVRSYDRGSVSYYLSQTPIWIPQAVLAASWVVLCLGLLARILRLATGRPAQPSGQSEIG